MINPQLRRLALRMAAINNAGEAFEQWHNHQWDRLVETFGEPHEQAEMLANLEPTELAEFNRYYAMAPKAETLVIVRGLLDAMGESFYNIDSRDRQYLAESRGRLLNAFVAMEEGYFERASEEAIESHTKLHWLLYERKRGHERANHTLVPEHMAWERLIAILADIDKVVKALNKPARIPLGGVPS